MTYAQISVEMLSNMNIGVLDRLSNILYRRTASGGKSRIVEANIAGTSFSTECSCMGLRATVDEFAPHTFSERNVPLAMSSRASGRIAAVELSKQACGQHADKQYAHT